MVRQTTYAIGLLSGIVLVVCDFYTSVIGLQSLLPMRGDLMMIVMPYALASLTLAMNCAAARLCQNIRRNIEKDGPLAVVALMFCFGVSVLFDFASSLTGLIRMVAGSDLPLATAFQSLDMTQLVTAVIVSILVTLGGFVTLTFSDLIKSEGGFFGGLISSIEEGETK